MSARSNYAYLELLQSIRSKFKGLRRSLHLQWPLNFVRGNETWKLQRCMPFACPLCTQKHFASSSGWPQERLNFSMSERKSRSLSRWRKAKRRIKKLCWRGVWIEFRNLKLCLNGEWRVGMFSSASQTCICISRPATELLILVVSNRCLVCSTHRTWTTAASSCTDILTDKG